MTRTLNIDLQKLSTFSYSLSFSSNLSTLQFFIFMITLYLVFPLLSDKIQSIIKFERVEACANHA